MFPATAITIMGLSFTVTHNGVIPGHPAFKIVNVIFFFPFIYLFLCQFGMCVGHLGPASWIRERI